MGMVKGIRKLSTFIKHLGAFNKEVNYTTQERERNGRVNRGGGRENGRRNNT